jgi:hypothetical protein
VPIRPAPPLTGPDKPYEQIIAYWERPGKGGANRDVRGPGPHAEEIWPLLLKTLQDLPDTATSDNTSTEDWITQTGLIPADAAKQMTTYQLYRAAKFRTDGTDPGPSTKGQKSPVTRASLFASLTDRARFRTAFGYDPDNPTPRKSSTPTAMKTSDWIKRKCLIPSDVVAKMSDRQISRSFEYRAGGATGTPPTLTPADRKEFVAALTTRSAFVSEFGYSPAAAPSSDAKTPNPTKMKADFVIPQHFQTTHPTDGLAGFPAYDFGGSLVPAGSLIGAPENGSITRISGDDPSDPPPKGVGGPWGLSVYFSGAETGNTYYMTHFDKIARKGFYKKGEVIGRVGDYPGLAFDHVHVGLHQGDAPEAHFASGKTNGTGPFDKSDFFGGPQGDAANEANSVASAETIAQNANLGFFSLQLQSTDFAESTLLQGKRALANDVSLFEWIQTMATAGGRSFCSLPNGDFYAFFPDYFRWFGERTPYFLIEDIEIIDLSASLSDRDLRTHVFTAGSRFSDQVESFDRILSQVASVEDETGFNVFVNFGRNGHRDKFNAIDFLKRFGARPEVYDMPQVRHPVLLWMAAWTKFAQMWAEIYLTSAEFTFMPELLPGGLVSFGNRFTMFVEEVRHDIDRSSGFRTTATLKAPSAEGKNDFLGPTLLTKAFGTEGHEGLVDLGPKKKRRKPLPKPKPKKRTKK